MTALKIVLTVALTVVAVLHVEHLLANVNVYVAGIGFVAWVFVMLNVVAESIEGEDYEKAKNERASAKT